MNLLLIFLTVALAIDLDYPYEGSIANCKATYSRPFQCAQYAGSVQCVCDVGCAEYVYYERGSSNLGMRVCLNNTRTIPQKKIIYPCKSFNSTDLNCRYNVSNYHPSWCVQTESGLYVSCEDYTYFDNRNRWPSSYDDYVNKCKKINQGYLTNPKYNIEVCEPMVFVMCPKSFFNINFLSLPDCGIFPIYQTYDHPKYNYPYACRIQYIAMVYPLRLSSKYTDLICTTSAIGNCEQKSIVQYRCHS